MVTPYFAHVLVVYSWTLSIVMYSLFRSLLTLISICLPLETIGLDLSSLDQGKVQFESKFEVGSSADREEQQQLISSKHE